MDDLGLGRADRVGPDRLSSMGTVGGDHYGRDVAPVGVGGRCREQKVRGSALAVEWVDPA